jgi:predicted transcriptional regulator
MVSSSGWPALRRDRRREGGVRLEPTLATWYLFGGSAGRVENALVQVVRQAERARDIRRDLAAMVAPLARTLIAAEEPVLRAHGISMWGYVVLTALAEEAAEPVRTQAALAQAIGADKSRIIGVLDELQEQGLIERYPDPADRRGAPARAHPVR